MSPDAVPALLVDAGAVVRCSDAAFRAAASSLSDARLPRTDAGHRPPRPGPCPGRPLEGQPVR